MADAAVPERMLTALDHRLAEFDPKIKAWREAREEEFARGLRRRDGPLADVMGRLPQAAAAARGVGEGPRDSLFAFFEEICDLYARAAADSCARLRELVHAHEARWLLADFVNHAARMVEKGGLAQWLDRGLAALSIDDQRRDYRDWLMALGDLYLAGRARGLDVSDALVRVAQRSNAEVSAGAPSATRRALERFEQSEYYLIAVAPRLR